MSGNSTGKSPAGGFLKRLNQPIGKKKRETRYLWEREFDIVNKGLDEKQVISFVDELTQKLESAPAKPAERLDTELEGTGASKKACLGLLKAREKTEDELREEYQKAYSRLLASLQDLIREGTNIESRLRDKTAKLLQVLNQEAEEFGRILSESSELAPATGEVSGGAVTSQVTQPRLEQKQQVQEEAIPENQTKDTGAGKESRLIPLRVDDPMLFSGELELDIAAPVDTKIVTRLFNYLQTVPEVKVVHTRGSWDHGSTIALMIEKPIRLIGLISRIEGIEGKLEVGQDDGEEEKEKLLLKRRRGPAKKIRLILG